MSIVLPDVLFGKVEGRFILAVADSSDPDEVPDAQVITGTVKFTPLVTIYKNPNPNAPVVVPDPIFATIDADGYLRGPDDTEGLWLAIGPYKVNYILDNTRLPIHRIMVTEFHTDETPLNLGGAIPPMGPVAKTGEYAALSARIDVVNANVLHQDDPRLSDAREPLPHNHDERYYTENEINDFFEGEETARASADSALSTRVNVLETAPGPDLSDYATNDDLSIEAISRANADSALDGRLDIIEAKPDLTTALATETSARISGDSALDARVDILEAVPPLDLSNYATDSELATGLSTKASVSHTHTSASITDFREAVEDAMALTLVGAGITITHEDGSNTITLTGVSGSDTEIIRDTIGSALVGVGPISIVPNDSGDTIVITVSATVNSTDAALRARSSHTGTQAIATVAGLQAALDAQAAAPPNVHGNSHKAGTGTDPITPSDIGAATAAQGAKADTAVQPATLTSTLAGYATAAQGAKADTAVQPATLTAAIAGFATPRFPAVFSDGRATLTVGAGTMKFPNYTGRTLTIVGVRVDVATAPTGAALIVDVNKNGTTIFTTQTNRPQIAAAGTTANAAAVNVTSLANGDYLTVDIDQVGSTVAGGSLTVTIILEG